MRKLANSAARDIASPAVKMGNKGLFPGVAVPLAFFCTLFFRHRKKSVSAPWDGQSLSAPESARQAPLRGNCLRQSCCLMLQAGGLSARPPCTPFGESAYPHRTGVCASGRVGGFPRGKQSAQPALPCVPLVVCLNSGSLTAFGGCIHWIPASLRSLPAPLRFACRNKDPHKAANPALRRGRPIPYWGR